jgi:hypothetical protein
MPGDGPPAEAFPLPEMDSRGIDLSQVRRMLALTVEERLTQLEAAQASMMELRDAFRRATEKPPAQAR